MTDDEADTAALTIAMMGLSAPPPPWSHAITAHLDDLREAKDAIMHDRAMTMDQRVAVLELIGEAVSGCRSVRVGWGDLGVLDAAALD